MYIIWFYRVLLLFVLPNQQIPPRFCSISTPGRKTTMGGSSIGEKGKRKSAKIRQNGNTVEANDLGDRYLVNSELFYVVKFQKSHSLPLMLLLLFCCAWSLCFVAVIITVVCFVVSRFVILFSFVCRLILFVFYFLLCIFFYMHCNVFKVGSLF